MKTVKKFFKILILTTISLSKEFYQLGVATLILLSLFYIRLLPRISRDLWEQMNNYQLLSTLLKICVILLNIYFLLKVLGKITAKKKSVLGEKIAEVFKSITDYFLWLLCNLYEFFWFIIDNISIKLFNFPRIHYHVIRKLAAILLNLRKDLLFCYILLSLKLLPKIAFIICFFIDVLIYKHLNYTFLCIPFLLICWLENFFLFIFLHYYDCNFKGIKSFLDKKEIMTETGPVIRYRFPPGTEEAASKYFKDIDDYFYNHWCVIVETNGFIEYYKDFKENYFPYYELLLILSVVRLFLLLFILFYGIL